MLVLLFLTSLSPLFCLPQFFDLRDKYPSCYSLHNPVFEGSCKSNWAISTTSVIADHYCFRGITNQSFSIEHLIQCDTTNKGCESGYLLNAYAWVKENYLVPSSCKAYKRSRMLLCSNNCDNGQEIADNQKFNISDYRQVIGDTSKDAFLDQVKEILYKNGSVSASIGVTHHFLDFLYDNSNAGKIYSKKADKKKVDKKQLIAYESVKIIGYGREVLPTSSSLHLRSDPNQTPVSPPHTSSKLSSFLSSHPNQTPTLRRIKNVEGEVYFIVQMFSNNYHGDGIVKILANEEVMHILDDIWEPIIDTTKFPDLPDLPLRTCASCVAGTDRNGTYKWCTTSSMCMLVKNDTGQAGTNCGLNGDELTTVCPVDDCVALSHNPGLCVRNHGCGWCVSTQLCMKGNNRQSTNGVCTNSDHYPVYDRLRRKGGRNIIPTPAVSPNPSFLDSNGYVRGPASLNWITNSEQLLGRFRCLSIREEAACINHRAPYAYADEKPQVNTRSHDCAWCRLSELCLDINLYVNETDTIMAQGGVPEVLVGKCNLEFLSFSGISHPIENYTVPYSVCEVCERNGKSWIPGTYTCDTKSNSSTHHCYNPPSSSSTSTTSFSSSSSSSFASFSSSRVTKGKGKGRGSFRRSGLGLEWDNERRLSNPAPYYNGTVPGDTAVYECLTYGCSQCRTHKECAWCESTQSCVPYNDTTSSFPAFKCSYPETNPLFDDNSHLAVSCLGAGGGSNIHLESSSNACGEAVTCTDCTTKPMCLWYPKMGLCLQRADSNADEASLTLSYGGQPDTPTEVGKCPRLANNPAIRFGPPSFFFFIYFYLFLSLCLSVVE